MRVEIEAFGFDVDGFRAGEEELREVAREISSDIAAHLCDLGTSAGHGIVALHVGENGSLSARSDGAVYKKPAAPHPLDEEEIEIVVRHVPTGCEGSAQDDPGTPVTETFARSLDDLLTRLEQRGG